ncbi:cell division protein FtsZ [candidate division NPL-UPA2 bacterium]|nr:cell division protein FtsZ [candidate division NPL-UPA2 bacterium]
MLELKDEFDYEADIKVIGVGGGGSNAVDHMAEVALSGIDFIAVNTDAQALRMSSSPQKIQIGTGLTKGLGSGANPEIGREAALEDRERIAEALKGADLVFITAGLGGGTGTGASPVIAEVAREAGALVVAVVTKPFLFEGRKRSLQAEFGLKELENKVNTLLCIPNQKLFASAGKEVSFLEAFKMTDNVLLQGIKVISDLITVPGLINLDLADVRTIIAEAGGALLGVGFGRGVDRVKGAVEGAVTCPLLEKADISGARGVLVNVTGGPDLSLQEVEEATTAIYDMVDGNANIIFGAVFDKSLKGEMKVTVLATGLKNGREEKQLSLRLDSLPQLQAAEVMTSDRRGLFRRKRKKKVAIPEGFVEEPALNNDLDIPTFIRWRK